MQRFIKCAEGRTRTGTACATDTSSLRVYQLHHFGGYRMLIPEPADIFKPAKELAGNHSRVLSDYAFPFFSRKNEKKREKLSLPPAPLVRALAGLENISSANAFPLS